MLTRKQHELLTYIDGFIKETGFSPSFEEMKDALQLRSKSGIHRLISALEERGCLKRRHNRARALEVMRMPNGPAPAVGIDDPEVAAENEPTFHPNVIRGDFTARLPGVRTADTAGAVSIPFYGRIAAGAPIEALSVNGAHVEVPAAWLGTGEHFALEIAGDSMIEAGINHGDTVVIRRTPNAENGEIVAVMVDDHEVTLKRLRRRNNSIALEPANARHETRIFPPDRVKVQGRLVALLRRF